jgi:two-component system sensor kinase FixL
VVNNILEYARMPTPDLGLANVANVIDDALVVAQVAAGNAVRVDRRGPAGLSWILDRALLSQALVNLFRNAGDAMAGGGTLGVSFEARDGGLEIAVSDSGPGIPPDRAESIFNPFFTTKARGAGLGLAVARAAVDAHGGTLELLPSEGGARFLLRLPRASLLETARATAANAKSPYAAAQAVARPPWAASKRAPSIRERPRSRSSPARRTPSWSPTCACRG